MSDMKRITPGSKADLARRMAERRRELIARPLAEIWEELAAVALDGSDHAPSAKEPRDVTDDDRSYASELLADLANTGENLSRMEKAARWFRKARVEHWLISQAAPLPPPPSLDHGGKAVIEGGSVVIRFPIEAMQSALDGAWGLNVFDRRQKVTDEAEFAKEFCRELNTESENGTTLIHRMADKAFVNMLEGGAFGFDEHEEQSL